MLLKILLSNRDYLAEHFCPEGMMAFVALDTVASGCYRLVGFCMTSLQVFSACKAYPLQWAGL